MHPLWRAQCAARRRRNMGAKKALERPRIWNEAAAAELRGGRLGSSPRPSTTIKRRPHTKLCPPPPPPVSAAIGSSFSLPPLLPIKSEGGKREVGGRDSTNITAFLRTTLYSNVEKIAFRHAQSLWYFFITLERNRTVPFPPPPCGIFFPFRPSGARLHSTLPSFLPSRKCLQRRERNGSGADALAATGVSDFCPSSSGGSRVNRCGQKSFSPSLSPSISSNSILPQKPFSPSPSFLPLPPSISFCQ